MKEIIEKGIEKAISYEEYRTLVCDLLADEKSTGPNQSDDLLNYSVLNDRRMKRLDKTISLEETTKTKLKNIKSSQTWLVLTEGWCGDAAQNLPIVNKIASENENIELKVVLRDENLELMDQFLTNGGRAIPKLIILDKDKNVVNTWGPRPTIATKMVVDYKEEHGGLDAEFKKNLQVWYNKNKGKNIQEDILSLLNN